MFTSMSYVVMIYYMYFFFPNKVQVSLIALFPEHTQESISSLRFAQKVNSTVIGPAKKRAQAT